MKKSAPFHGQLAVTIASCYSPTDVTDEDEKEVFFAELTNLIKTQYQNIISIGADMNLIIEKLDATGRNFTQETLITVHTTNYGLIHLQMTGTHMLITLRQIKYGIK